MEAPDNMDYQQTHYENNYEEPEPMGFVPNMTEKKFKQEVKKAEKRGEMRGMRKAVSAIISHFYQISFFIYHVCVPSQRCYKILRNLMMFGFQEGTDVRRCTIKIGDRSMPTFASLEAIKTLNELNMHCLRMPTHLYLDQGICDYYGNDSHHYIGSYIAISARVKQMGFKVANELPPDFLMPYVIQVLIWTDGARVERATVYSRIRFVDGHRILFENGVSPLFFWYAFNGGEHEVWKINAHRILELEYLVNHYYCIGDRYYIFKIKYISADHKMQKIEMGQTDSSFRCCICTQSYDDATWMEYTDSTDKRRNVGKQKAYFGDDRRFGVGRMPLLAESTMLNRHNEIVCVVPLLHDVKATLNSTLLVLKQFVRRHGPDGKMIFRTMQLAQGDVETRTFDLWGEYMSYGRQARAVISSWRVTFNNLLPLESLRSFTEISAIFSSLAYQTEYPANVFQHYCRLLVYTYAHIHLLHFFWMQTGFLQKIPRCDAVYHHSLIAHLADQFLETRILPVFLGEEDGEGSIRLMKKARSNHWPTLSIDKQIIYEQISTLSDKLLAPSEQRESKKKYNQSNLTPQTIKNITIWVCAFKLVDDNTLPNIVEKISNNFPNWIQYDENRITFILTEENLEAINVCICGSHTTVDCNPATRYEPNMPVENWVDEYANPDWELEYFR